MSGLRFDIDWQFREDVDPLLGGTSCNLGIMLDDVCLTQNVDFWSRTTRDQVLVSVYPLAMWMASSWWRLHHEVLPTFPARMPPQDWRLSHEMTAASSGYVWPLLVFSTDRKVMNVWAEPFPPDTGHSVRYLTGLNAPAAVSMAAFNDAFRNFIDQVVARVTVMGHDNSELAQLWSLILSDLDDPAQKRNRRIEAQFGFDPEDCPTSVLANLIALEDDRGEDVLAELAAVRAWHNGDGAHWIRGLFEVPGIEGQPELPQLPLPPSNAAPWEQAKADATALRCALGAGDSALTDPQLRELLGVSVQTLEELNPTSRPAAVAGCIDDRRFRFVPRKRHPIARRFELARFVGGYTDAVVRDGNSWFASTDAGTARQKYQRAFAAEFLCPIRSLRAFLNEDFSDDAVENAATEFGVSDWTVVTQLMNNHCLPRPAIGYGPPYSLVA